MTMAGTQIQCSSSLAEFWWLAPYSSSHWCMVRMAGKATPRPLVFQQRPFQGGTLQECGMALMAKFMRYVSRSGILSDAHLLELYPPFRPMRIKVLEIAEGW